VVARIGPKMLLAAEWVAAHPGCNKIGAAHYASPRPGNARRGCGLRYGYDAVNRALGAGLIANWGPPDGPYRLAITGKGARLLGLPVCADCGEPAEHQCISCDAQLCADCARATSVPGDTFCLGLVACAGRYTMRKVAAALSQQAG
jgi:hypothetical protein